MLTELNINNIASRAPSIFANKVEKFQNYFATIKNVCIFTALITYNVTIK